jgi:hypothetical protein
VIVSVHLADVGPARALKLLRTPLDAAGLAYAELTTLAPLGPHTLPSPTPGRVGLIAAWEHESALEGFLERHPLARRLAHGWRVRLQPTRIFGAWPELPGIVPRQLAMDDAEPVAVMTLGRLRLTQTRRFLHASAGAEGLAVSHPALLASTGMARPPRLVATFSLWSGTGAMRDYVEGRAGTEHRAAMDEHARRSFHHASAFIRFRPYGAEGRWRGAERLDGALAGTAS